MNLFLQRLQIARRCSSVCRSAVMSHASLALVCALSVVGFSHGFSLVPTPWLRQGVTRRSARSARGSVGSPVRSAPPALRMDLGSKMSLTTRTSILENMEQIGATYCILWKPTPSRDKFTVVKDYTTAARKKAQRRVRGDDKLYATESRRFTPRVDGTGPIATTYRTGKQVIIDDVRQLTQRAAIAQEFGVKRIFFVPVDGGVLEYGTPSGEEVMLFNLLQLTVAQMVQPGSFRAFFKLLGELFLCLRLLITVEENNLVNGVKKSLRSFLTAVFDLDQKARKKKTERPMATRVAVFFLQVLIAFTSPLVWLTSYFVDSYKARKRAKQRTLGSPLGDEDEAWMRAVKLFEQADLDRNGVLTYDEFTQAFGRSLQDNKIENAWEEFDALDTDRDGSISFEEFKQAVRMPWFAKVEPWSPKICCVCVCVS